MKKISCFAILFSLFITSLAMSQIPKTMSYQGILTDIAGVPVADGTFSLTFRLYDAATNGTELWKETQNIDVKNGIFNAVLGSINSLNLPCDIPYWLGITLGQDAEMIPRIALTASPYSLGGSATVSEPIAGRDFVIRNASGEVREGK